MKKPSGTHTNPSAGLSDVAETETAAIGLIDIQSTDTPSAGPKLRADAARNRERVLTAAAKVFADRGLDVSLDEVARAAGVGVGTVYRRFSDKEALVKALFEDKIENVVVFARESMMFEDPWEGFVHFIERALDLQVQNRGLRDALLHSEFGRAGAARTRAVVTPMVTTIIERAQAAGRLRSDLVAEDVPMLVTMLGAVSDFMGPSDPELWQRYRVLILDGLVAQRAGWTPLSNPPSREVVDAAMTKPL
ncbi:MAG: TetR/AcrR family transcriptional regulator [Acidimicrobiaceae bacterium]|nr:TetR/AcrR family transcriptional regulator [Acidimicrobiaceae bacterium]